MGAISVKQWLVLVFPIENVGVQHCVVPPLLFKEVPVGHVVLIGIYSDEVASSVVLKDTLLDHGVVRQFFLRAWLYGEWKSCVTQLVLTSYTIQLLFEYFWQEGLLKNAATLDCLSIAVLLLITASFLLGVTAVLNTVLGI